MISEVLPEVHGAYSEAMLDRRADLLAQLKRTPVRPIHHLNCTRGCAGSLACFKREP